MAGLPNITGSNTSGDWALGNADVWGCFYKASGGGDRPPYSSGGGYYHYFDASRSSSIYGSSTTVTPLSESVIMCISY